MRIRHLAQLSGVGALIVFIAGATGCSSSSSPAGPVGTKAEIILANAGAFLDGAIVASDQDDALSFDEVNFDADILVLTLEEFNALDLDGDTYLTLDELVSQVASEEAGEEMVAVADVQSVLNGGRLYDKWWADAGTTPPDADHDFWEDRPVPDTNTAAGPGTWRCKECHGWDYKGVDGAYGTGSSHETGFAGIFERVLAITSFITYDLIDTDHGYGDIGLKALDIFDLTNFVQDPGLVDTGVIIDGVGAFIIDGGSTAGLDLYTAACFGCHGVDGLNMGGLFLDEYHDEYPGVLSNDNPWEFQHKVRYGHPGSAMVGQAGLTVPEIGNLGAHAQTLPEMLPFPVGTLDVVNGGRLYDKWWADSGATPPATDHPIWADQSTNLRTGADTWRCKECHGWDYKGAAGAYDPVGGSDHATGFAGIFGTAMTLQEVYNTIWTDHQYGNKMPDADIQDAAEFVVNGQFDVDDIIDGAGLFIGDGTPAGLGFDLYTNRSCLACHGPDGLSIAGVDPGDLSRTNPQEFQHKINYGQPGSNPNMGWASTLLVADTGRLGAYVQQQLVR